MNIALLFLLLAGVELQPVGQFGQGSPVRIVRIEVSEHRQVYSLTRELGLDVADAQADHIIAYADDAMIERVRARGFRVTVLVEDHTVQSPQELQTYHSFAQVCSIMQATAAAYPHICRLETLGSSYGGRPIIGALVTESPWTSHDRPCVRLIGAHHGNEKISTEVTLSFLLFLCENYQASPQVQELVNSRLFWVIPVMNPDGHLSNSRYNGAGVDLNRDYGWEWQAYSSPFTQPETRAIMRHGSACLPGVEYEYHSTASYVNYLWDNTPHDPPDSGLIMELARRYADSTYGSSTTRLTRINGYDWYEVHGSCQDWVFGALGGIANTIETRQPSDRPRVDSICVANRRALLDMATIAGWGLRGRVYDSISNEPLFARIEVISPRRWNVCTNGLGGFAKMLAPGVYSVRVRANGYVPKEFSGVVVPETGAVFLDVALNRPVAEPLCYCQQIVALRRDDDNHLQTSLGMDALGEPDQRYYRVGPGSIIFRLDEPVCNRSGDDITVFATGSWTVAGTNDLFGTWTTIGSGSGQQSLDIGSVGLDSCRFLRLSEQANCQLDAIGYLGRERVGVGEARIASCWSLSVLPSVVRRGAGMVRIGGLPQGQTRGVRVSVFDALGRCVGQQESSEPLLDISGLPSGVYLIRAAGIGGTGSARLVVD